MSKTDIHIGPAHTLPAYRGRGYYRMLISYVVQRHPDSVIWMIVAEDNTASRCGVESVGFEPGAYLKQNRITKRFSVSERITPQ